MSLPWLGCGGARKAQVQPKLSFDGGVGVSQVGRHRSGNQAEGPAGWGAAVTRCPCHVVPRVGWGHPCALRMAPCH